MTLHHYQHCKLPMGCYLMLLADTSATYMTARQVGDRRQQEELWTSLISARQEVNAAIDLLPASRRSRTLLLAAMLKRHRSDFKVGQNFIDDMQFYTDVIEMAVDWLNTDCTSCVGVSDSSSQWMTIYGHFLNSVNFLTGEQSLCNAFSSLVCFSNRERLFYVNFTFSGEATFRLYRRSYPAGHVILTDRWWGRNSDHTSLFPTLAQCRRDVVEDLNYYSLSSDQDQREICDLSRRNETRSHEVSDLLQTEMDTIATLATINLQQEVSVASRRYVAIACLLAISVCYCLVISGLNIVDVVHHYVKLKRLRKELELQALCVEDSCCREFHKLGLDRAHACGSLPDDKQDSCALLSPTTSLTRTRSNYSNGSLGAAMTDCLLRDSNHANIRTKDVSGDIIDCPLTCQIRIATV